MMRSGVLRRLFRALCLCSLVLVSAAAPLVSADEANGEPQPNTPIEHFIYLMQENHSFDNYFGTYPGADGIPPNTCMPEDPTDPDNKKCIEPFHLGTRPVEDLDHNLITHERQFRDGQMDGFAYAFRQEGKDGELTMGHYDDRDLPFYWNVADEYVLFDRFFAATAAGSVASHMLWVAGTTGAPDETLGNLPTIFDRLDERGVSWKFYVEDYNPRESAQAVRVPVIGSPRYVDDPRSNRIVDLEEYYEDLRSG